MDWGEELVQRTGRELTRLRKKARACPEPSVLKLTRAPAGETAALEDNFGPLGTVSLVRTAGSPFPWALAFGMMTIAVEVDDSA